MTGETKHVCLLTGGPGSGKTTLIKKVLSRVRLNAGGFYTEEVRVQGVRQGFKIITLDGKIATLAHINISSPYRVSKYGVDLKGLESLAVPAIRQAIRDRELVVVDEIGKMELFSSPFREAVMEAIQSGKPVLGTIMLKPHPWADGIKHHPAVEVLFVDQASQDRVARQVLEFLQSCSDKNCRGS